MELRAIVIKSKSRNSDKDHKSEEKYKGKVTLVDLANSNKNGHPQETFKMIGQHRIDKGENILVTYETHMRINWIQEYSILDNKGNEKYTSIRED